MLLFRQTWHAALKLDIQQLEQCLTLQGQTLMGHMCVHMQVHHSAVSIPGRALGGVIQALKPDLPEPGYAVISKFHMDVVSLLKAGGPGHAPKLEQSLREAMPHLKDVAVGSLQITE